MNVRLEATALGGIVVAFVLMKLATRGSRESHETDEGAVASPLVRREARLLERLAVQDWLVAGYVVTLWMLVLAGQGERRHQALTWLTLDLVGFLALLVTARAPSVPRPIANVAYRLALPGAIVTTFTQLHYILPSARSSSYDAEIYGLDKAIFGFEPAEAWDRFVNPQTTEWFSFFYYLYFGILLVHVVPMAVFERRMNVLREFSWGIFSVFCVGQIVYTILPGFGPYRLLASRFTHPLEGALFWPLVAKTVASFDGAHRTDIFPSLHTAVPSFFTLFAFRHRDKVPFKYTWPIMAFVTVNIILATMFLRWHYLLDVFAGLTLATSAFLTASHLPAREDALRKARGLPPIWLPLFGNGPSPPVRVETDDGVSLGEVTPKPLHALSASRRS